MKLLSTKILSKGFAVLGFGLVLSLCALVHSSQAGATGTYSLTGRTTNPGGGGLSGVTVTAKFPGTGTIMAGPVTSNSSGYYTLPIDAGTYDVTFDPGFTSIYTPTTVSGYSVSGNQTLNQQMPAKINTMSGVLTDSNGTPIPNVTVRLTANGGNTTGTSITDSNGNYSISIAAGTYALSINATQVGGMSSFTLAQSSANPGINLTSSITRNLTLPIIDLTTTPYNDAGQPNYGTTATARTNLGTTGLYSGDTGETISVISNGFYTNNSTTGTIKTISGAIYNANSYNTTNNTNSICELVNQSTSTYDCLASPLSVNTSTNVAVPADPPVSRNFSGVLTDSNGSPIPTAQVTLIKYGDRSTTTTTDSNGNFSVNAEPGKYYLEVVGNNVDGILSFKVAQSSTNPSVDLRSSNVSQNLQLRTTTLSVTAYDSSGNPNYFSSVNAQTANGSTTLYSGDPGESVTILSNGFSTTTNPTGNIGTIIGAIYSGKGNTTNPTGSICEFISSPSNWTCLTNPYTVTGAASIGVPQ